MVELMSDSCADQLDDLVRDGWVGSDGGGRHILWIKDQGRFGRVPEGRCQLYLRDISENIVDLVAPLF